MWTPTKPEGLWLETAQLVKDTRPDLDRGERTEAPRPRGKVPFLGTVTCALSLKFLNLKLEGPCPSIAKPKGRNSMAPYELSVIEMTAEGL